MRRGLMVALCLLAGCARDTWDGYARGFFARHCAACHPAFTDRSEVTRRAGRMIRMLETQRMPPHGLDAGERRRIVRWLEREEP